MGDAEVRYVRNEDFVHRRIVDEMVLVPIRQNIADMDAIYTINPVGAFVWERLDKPATLAELQAAVLDEYAAEPQEVAADLEGFVQEMLSIDAIRRV